MWPIIGTEAIASGALTRGQLRWRYTALFPDIYVPSGERVSLSTRAVAAWLWSGRDGVLAGTAAADLHGAYSVDDSAPIELIARHRRTPPGIVIRQERIGDDEVCHLGELRVSTPARTALDLARHLPRDDAVIMLDKLGVNAGEIATLISRYRGSRGIDAARVAVGLTDGGAGSPNQTLLRLMLIDAGLPRPQTCVPIGDEFTSTVIAIGWTGPKVGVEFVDLRTDLYGVRQQILHQDLLRTNGWMGVQVPEGDYRLQSTVRRVREALRLQRITGRRA